MYMTGLAYSLQQSKEFTVTVLAGLGDIHTCQLPGVIIFDTLEFPIQDITRFAAQYQGAFLIGLNPENNAVLTCRFPKGETALLSGLKKMLTESVLQQYWQ